MFEDLRQANDRYVTTFNLGSLTAIAQKSLAIVTCLDTRIDPLAILGLQPGEAKIIRNAGGRVTDDVLRSLTLVTNLLGVSRIAVMHHTQCALGERTEEQVRALLAENDVAAHSIERFLAMPDLNQALADDIARLRAWPDLPNVKLIEGWRYHVETGVVETVIASGDC